MSNNMQHATQEVITEARLMSIMMPNTTVYIASESMGSPYVAVPAYEIKKTQKDYEGKWYTSGSFNMRYEQGSYTNGKKNYRP